MAQIDTFDPKKLGDAKAKRAGSYYPAIDTAVAQSARTGGACEWYEKPKT